MAGISFAGSSTETFEIGQKLVRWLRVQTKVSRVEFFGGRGGHFQVLIGC